MLFRFSDGSVKADVRVLATLNTKTTNKDEVIEQLIVGLDSTIRRRLNVTFIVVLGEQKYFSTDVLEMLSAVRYVFRYWLPAESHPRRIHNTGSVYEPRHSQMVNIFIILFLP